MQLGARRGHAPGKREQRSDPRLGGGRGSGVWGEDICDLKPSRSAVGRNWLEVCGDRERFSDTA
jgi:hypothetical protein